MEPRRQTLLGRSPDPDHPPFTQVLEGDENLLAEPATSDISRFEDLSPVKVETFTFTGANGVTELHGMLHKPSGFDPSRKHLVLVSVYAGLIGTGARERWTTRPPTSALRARTGATRA